jgi:signal transduction histidine kinase
VLDASESMSSSSAGSQLALAIAARRGAKGKPSVAPPIPENNSRLGGRLRPQLLLELACRALRAVQGGLGFLTADGKLLDLYTYGLSEPENATLRASSVPAELLHFVLRRPIPSRLAPTEAGDADGSSPQDGSDICHCLPACLQLSLASGPSIAGPFMGVPLTGPGRCRGALYFLREAGEPAFEAQDEALVLPLTSWLEEGNFFEEARLLAQVRLLNQVAQAAAGHQNLTRTFQTTLHELDRNLHLHVSAIWLVDEPEEPDSPTNNPTVSLADRSPLADGLGLTPGLCLPIEQTPFAACLKDGQAEYLELDKEAPGSAAPLLAALLAARGANASFAVPLRAGDCTVGVLQSICTRPSGFTNEQIQLLYLAADLLGPAIRNGQLFDRLHRAYEELRVTQSQLIQAEKMRALGELAGGMAHEFNNSLCGVLGFLELGLWDRSLAETTRGYLESARTCALDAAHTVRRVQDFARQRPSAPMAALDLNELVLQTLPLIRHKWENLQHARGLPIQVEVQPTAQLPICGQTTELREVLTNLIFNAVDAMPKGGTLTVRTWSTADDVFLSVRDAGMGISEADRSRLFEPFFTTKGERGNGLGLSITFAIIRRHGGDITAESELERGSTFTIRLPAAPAMSQGLHPVEEAAPAAAAASLRVLVVEDEESIRRFLGMALEGLGHQPHVVANATDGLTALAEGRFDVVLTDLGLPGISGEEVARAVARQTPSTPVVLLTGWADQLQAEQIKPEGVTCVLSKPVTIDTLKTTLASIVKE